ncbi:hypothetical protein ACFQ0M_28480 [Kitasatospora aburaviensis]
MRKGAKIGIITGVSLAVLAGGGYGAYSLVGGSDSGTPEAKKPRTVVAEPPPPSRPRPAPRTSWRPGPRATSARRPG